MPADIPVLGYSYNLNHIWCRKPYFNISHVKKLFPPSWHRDMCCCLIQKKIIFPVKYLQFASQSKGAAIHKNHKWDKIPAAPPLHYYAARSLLLFLIFPCSSQAKHRGSGWVMGWVDRASCDVMSGKADPMRFRGQVKTLPCTHRAAPGTSSDSSFSPTSSPICSNFFEPFMLPAWILIWFTIHMLPGYLKYLGKKPTQIILTDVTTEE